MARKSYKQKYNSEDGVWRTIGGRRVFIRHGQKLSEAMKESGKFKTGTRHEVQQAIAEKKIEKLGKENEEIWKKTNKFDDSWYDENGKLTKEGEKLYNRREKNAEEMKMLQQFNRDYQPRVWEDDRYNNPKEYPGILSDLEGKHMLGNKYRKLENDYSDLSWKMQDSDYYYKPEDDRKLQKLRADADTERLKLGIDTQDKYDNMMYKKNMYYNNNEMPAYKDPYVQKQVGIDTAKTFGAKSVTINGEKIDLSKERALEEVEKRYGKEERNKVENALADIETQKVKQKQYEEKYDTIIHDDGYVESVPKGNDKKYNPFVTEDGRVSVVKTKNIADGTGYIGYDTKNNAYHNAYKSKEAKDVNTSGPYRTFEEAERDLDNTYSTDDGYAESKNDGRIKDIEKKLQDIEWQGERGARNDGHLGFNENYGTLTKEYKELTGKDYKAPFKQGVYKEKKSGNDYLPKTSKITTQGTSNRKEVSDNIQAHILEYYDNPVDFMEQMDSMDWLPTRWRAGEKLASGGSYLIYYDDQREFLDSLGINPKGKTFSDDRVFQTYNSLVGRESERLYNRLEKLFEQYKKEHHNSEASLDDFRKWFK